MSLPSAEEIVNLFLYGVSETPSNLASDEFIDQDSAIREVNVNEYMQGPGRFISPVAFEIVNKFFGAEIELAPGAYPLERIKLLLDVEQRGVRIQQYYFDDGLDNYAERVFIWNSTTFEIESGSMFIVGEDGTRHIEEFSIIPHNLEENFDLVSNDGLTGIANEYVLTPGLDPSKIGNQVKIEFTGDRVRVNYNIDNYLFDSENYDDGSITNLQGLELIFPVIRNLFESGTTRFLEDNKPILYGTNGDDRITGTVHPFTDVDFSANLYCQLRDYVENGIHYIAGDGNDIVNATQYNDVIQGGSGDDTLSGEAGNDYLEGNDGEDTLLGNRGQDWLFGGAGNDTMISGGADKDVVSGGAGNDHLEGGNAMDELFGGSGVDTLQGDAGHDTLLGSGYYNDSYWWNPDFDELSYAADYRIGTDSADVIYTGSGDDTVNAREGNDRVRGEHGNDVLNGDAGNDRLYGDEGDDVLNGGDGIDSLFGGIGDDTLRSGGGSRNTLSGEQGNDTYLFGEGDGNVSINNRDSISSHPLALAERIPALTNSIMLQGARQI